MDRTTAIEAFNASSQPQIEPFTTRDARVVAKLPRVNHEIILKDSSFNRNVLAWT